MVRHHPVVRHNAIVTGSGLYCGIMEALVSTYLAHNFFFFQFIVTLICAAWGWWRHTWEFCGYQCQNAKSYLSSEPIETTAISFLLLKWTHSLTFKHTQAILVETLVWYTGVTGVHLALGLTWSFGGTGSPEIHPMLAFTSPTENFENSVSLLQVGGQRGLTAVQTGAFVKYNCWNVLLNHHLALLSQARNLRLTLLSPLLAGVFTSPISLASAF